MDPSLKVPNAQVNFQRLAFLKVILWHLYPVYCLLNADPNKVHAPSSDSVYLPRVSVQFGLATGIAVPVRIELDELLGLYKDASCKYPGVLDASLDAASTCYIDFRSQFRKLTVD